ncbi:MAG TPA: alpha-ketoglutarate-dependent dioxygenase AlkB [Actinomycetota bacterium]|nr:alpha-ketoglutarate-dependent dioxygenase AlkB [Actinomycetota bacterium]
MAASPDLIWQPSLLSAAEPTAIDPSFSDLHRVQLDDESWVDHAPGWISGPDALFEAVLNGREWQQRSRPMYDRRVLEPRLTAPWFLDSGRPLEPPILGTIRQALIERYGRVFDSVGFNLYRDGSDSVAWHADHIAKEIEDPIVALVSVGEPRKFLLRPKGGGPSHAFLLGRGDLLVTGGKTQRTWEHSVPKVARAGPRISMAFRHNVDPSIYERKRVEMDRPQGDSSG